ncbi:MAG TPA: riboflavin synthase [Gaiellaceae bacterium]
MKSAVAFDAVFTGIVRQVGRVVAAAQEPSGMRLEVEASETAAALALGDSVSVSGCCLTAVAVADGRIAFDVVPESLARTTLAELEPGDRVNVEPALRAGDPLGGHYVQGHVEAVGRVRRTNDDGDGRRLWVDAPPNVLRYLVEKGSVTVDGTSLTVSALDEAGFEVALAPHTLAATTLGDLAPGDRVNLEPDVLAKYVERLLETRR